MITNLSFLNAMAVLILGLFILCVPKEVYAGLAPVSCCQLEGSCFDTSGDGEVALCQTPFLPGEFCNDDSGLCTPVSRTTTNIPTLSEWGMISIAMCFGLIGLFFVFRRRVAL